ncbi:MAG: prepilin-type N-terminal cleavage/methylation domain-containing protein [Desulforhopalus sp.]|jgi:prepilin-type N-terminal cleavage/methylation domain-containing protein
MRHFPSTLHNDSGFTLIEVIIAMAVLTIGIFSLFSMQTVSTMSNIKASIITTASNSGMDLIEEIIETDYTDLNDINDDGTPGLDELTSPDVQTTSDDDQYTLNVNVAEDYPIEGCKTVRIHIQDNNQHMKNAVTYQYIKEKSI